ncbi:hypothetical protein H4R33_001614 [Dimargaris cristalligena]|nr:hypothetical protein H4R33_001614 [Dimargaris cristalligena]
MAFALAYVGTWVGSIRLWARPDGGPGLNPDLEEPTGLYPGTLGRLYQFMMSAHPDPGPQEMLPFEIRLRDFERVETELIKVAYRYFVRNNLGLQALQMELVARALDGSEGSRA